MSESLSRVFTSGPPAWTGLGRPQQALLLLLAALLPVVLFVGSRWVTDGQYVPLFASLTTEEAAAIVGQLRSSKTPYRIAGGDQILVPADQAAEIRLRAAVQGLPLGGGVGFEVFDRPSLGASDFTQRLNYQRALQGELARTIGQLREVARARVHLVVPQPSLFTERERPASASVFLKLVPGGQLGREQIRGIVHLVASSVEGLTPERITVVDTSGRVLSAGNDAAGDGLSPRRMETKAAVEEGIERRIQSLLDTTIGPGQAVVRVAAQLNFDQVERTEEKFDPAAVARQRTRSVESSKGRSAAPIQAATGPDPVNPPEATTSTLTENEGRRQSETTSYEISRTVARTLTTPGDIRRLTVSVILNTPTRLTESGNGKEVREPLPRSVEDLDKIRAVVMAAVGFNEGRGDQVTVVELPFDTSALDRERELLDQPVAEPAPDGRLLEPWMLAVAGGVVSAFLVMLVLLLRRRSRREALTEVALSLEGAAGAVAPPGAGAVAPHAGPAGNLQGGSGRGHPALSEEFLAAGREREAVRERAAALASQDPDTTAQLMRAWLVKKRTLRPVRGNSSAT
jgi:flagellar M-ring protein FliF